MMNKNKFIYIMNQIRKARDFERNLRKAYVEYNGAEFFSYGLFVDPAYEDIILSLLEDIMNDHDEWIRYWVDELDCGDNWKPGMIKDVNGKDANLSTVNDLWNFLAEFDK